MKNGVLAKGLREQMEIQDLSIKEVAAMIHRDDSTVFRILQGKPTRPRTLRRIYLAFPALQGSTTVVMR
jgi:predicted transcriptional regulator